MDVPLAGFLSCFLSCLLTCGATAGVGHVGGAAIGGAVGVAVSLLFSICILQGVRVYISAPLKDLYMVSGTMHGVSAQFKRPQRFDTFEEFANLKRRYLTADSYKPEPELPEADEPSDLLPEARSASSLSIPSAPILTFGASVPAPTGKVTFVFTDIEASSNLWCDHPEDMKVAMRLHNNMMRQCYQKYSGYEVKTIGDAFMITFESAENALNFCMEAQTTLLNADWPDDILLDSHCAPITKDGQLIFRGMRVRMGVHIGSVGVEVDPVSNRSDYYGHTVNIAARIESAGKGGCIICSEEIVSSISAPQSLACTFVNLGPVVLKGVGTVSLTGVLPNAISHRGTGLANPKKKASNTGSSSSQPSPMKSIPFSTTPGGAGHSKSSAFFKLLVKDMYNDRLLSDSLIRSTLESFMTSEELQPVNATVIQLRLTQNTQLLSPLLRSLSNIAKRTFGMLLSVATTTVTIVWFCQQHAIQASSCAALVFAELSGSYKIHMGMASGGVLLGVTHTGDDKHFITCIGSPVELSGALAEAAEQLNAPCLVPGTFVASVSSLARLLRPIDRWPFAGITQACVEVNELYMPGLEGVEKWDLLYGMQEDKTWVDAGYIAAYEASKNGDVTLMKNVLGRNPSDEVAKRIVMAKGKQITRTEFLPGTHIKTQDSIGAKEDLEAAWKRTTAASRSSTAELVYMEGWAYDVSTFMHSHPGGRETIKPHFGTDITDAFHGLGGGHEHSTYAAEILRTLRVFKTNNLATNESNMLIVRDTWKELRAVGMKEIGVLLFRNIFMSDPELLALFPWGGDRNVYESKGLHDHGLQVMTAIDKAVTDLSKSHEVAHILHELGKTHIRYGIKRNMFDIMGEAFDLTFRQALVDRYTPQVRYAWMATIRQVLLMAKDGIAVGRDSASQMDALVVDEYRKIKFVRKHRRTATATQFTFHILGIGQQYVPPGSHVSLRFNGKLSRPYSILEIDKERDEVTFLIRLVEGSHSAKELGSLSTSSFVEGRGLLLSEHQYLKGQDLCLIGGGTGCVPLLSLARAALADGAKVWFLVCAGTFAEVGLSHELEQLLKNHDKMFSLQYLFTKVGYEMEAAVYPEDVPEPIHAPLVVHNHVKSFFPQHSESNHVVVCGRPEFNYGIREVIVSLDYTLSILGMIRKPEPVTVSRDVLKIPGLVVTAY